MHCFKTLSLICFLLCSFVYAQNKRDGLYFYRYIPGGTTISVSNALSSLKESGQNIYVEPQDSLSFFALLKCAKKRFHFQQKIVPPDGAFIQRVNGSSIFYIVVNSTTIIDLTHRREYLMVSPKQKDALLDLMNKYDSLSVSHIAVNNNFESYVTNHALYMHEYGHYIQSQQHGPLYLFTVGIPSLQSAIMETNNPQVPRHHDRWFEADASYKGAEYFDKYYGSKQTGYVTGDPNYFDKDSFKYGNKSTYINPRTGILNQTTNPISGYFHWTDIAIYFPVIGLLPTLFYL